MNPRGELITLKDKDWLKRQTFAGSVICEVHNALYKIILGHANNLTLRNLNTVAQDIIKSHGCTPTFLNYNGFPSVICASLNKEIVHGFGTRDVQLQSGDVIKIDVGVTFEGAIADCAMTYVYGKSTDKIYKMLISCQEALYDGIKQFKCGNRVGDIGKAIFQKSKVDGFGVITNFGGHGIDQGTLHAAPFVPNKSSSEEGVRIHPGMSIAIEPMFVLGNNINTRVMKDKWSVQTADIGCHYEHSVTLDENGELHIISDHGIFAKDFVK